ncbi:aminotransferase class IV [Rurimicrobium arvi]
MFSNWNGRITPAAAAPSASVDAFRLRYGLYETYLCRNGSIEYASLHWQRMREGLKVLGFSVPAAFSENYLYDQMLATIAACGLADLCRIRVQIYTDSETAPFEPQWIIEVFPLAVSMTQWLSAGIRLAVLDDFVRDNDATANFKISHNRHFLPARAAVEAGVADDVLLRNAAGNLVESAIANLFWIKDGCVFTPPLSEGCLAGTIRKLIIDRLQEHGIPLSEQPATDMDLLYADEIFLSNGIRKIRWVREFNRRIYDSGFTRRLCDLLFGE